MKTLSAEGERVAVAEYQKGDWPDWKNGRPPGTGRYEKGAAI